MSFPQIFFDATPSTLQLRCALPAVLSRSIPSSCTAGVWNLLLYFTESCPSFLNWMTVFSDFYKAVFLRCSFTRSSNLERGVPLMKSITGVKAPKAFWSHGTMDWCDMCDALTCLKPCGLPCPGSEAGRPLPAFFFVCRLSQKLRTALKEHQVPVQEEHDG